ncbi:alpha/beta fold hydrolase [Aurantiacibacter sp. D1-12]|uniref:alpha/beta fold hydrolase n=1 Tax=Aurantiacibacter sp. D1-12 TaxID=2993658 RepID=UPI00237D09DC|nr:alpha/beta hydrolase [Aurantiacibacter sp. D1-12]MDE1468350.1 alpha/beta hydrolase [Aurantiacibacter sp. D1-12]
MKVDVQDWASRASHFDFQGHKIAYWTGGSGPALLLVHGFPTCSWDWCEVWDDLAQHHTLIACDMLGFGLSDKPKAPYSLFRQADLQEALLSHLGVTEWDALVHDYGVSVGQEMLARQQEGSGAARLGSMVFLNGGIFPGEHRPRLIQKLGASPLGPLVSLMMNRKRFDKSFAPIFGPDTQPSEAELDGFWQMIAAQDGHRNAHRLLAYMAERTRNKARWVGALEKAQDRIGLIDGALDPISGEHVYHVWRKTLPNAWHHLLRHVGHYPQVEAPEEVARITLEWLAAKCG